MEQAAKEKQIPLSYGVLPEMLSDVWGIEKAQTKAVSGQLVLPRRYSHSPYEVMDIKVVEQGFTIICDALHILSGNI